MTMPMTCTKTNKQTKKTKNIGARLCHIQIVVKGGNFALLWALINWDTPYPLIIFL